MTLRPPHPYARRHLASHAAEAGRLDEDVLSLETLPYLDQARLSTLLRLTEAPVDSPLWLLLGAWRTVRHRWSWDDPDSNAAALDVAFLAAGGWPAGPRRTASGLTWVPRWAEWQSGGTIVAGGEDRALRAVAVGNLAGVSVLAVGGQEGVQLWDAATGQPVGEPLPTPDPVQAVAVVRETGLVVAVAADALTVWDGVTHIPRHVLRVPGEAFRAMAVGQLGDRWIVATGGTAGRVRLWELVSGQWFGEFRAEAPVRGLALARSQTGELLLAIGTGDGGVETRDVASGRPSGPRLLLGAEVNGVALAAMGPGLVLAAGTADGVARLWDPGTGNPTSPPLRQGDEVRAVALTRVDGRGLLATGSLDGTVRLWDGASGHELGPPLVHPHAVLSVAFGEVDGRTMLATACADGNARLWDPIRPSAARLGSPGRLPSVGVTGELVVAGTEDRRVRIWRGDVESPSAVLHLDEAPALGIDGADAPLGKFARPPGVGVRVGRVSGRHLLLTTRGGRVEAWDVEGLAAPVRIATHGTRDEDGPPAVTHVSSGRALVARSADWSEPLRISDVLTGEVLLSIPRGEPLAFSEVQGATVLAVLDGDRLRLLDVDAGEPAYKPVEVRRWTRHVAIGTLGGVPVLATYDGEAITLVDLKTGARIVPDIPRRSSARGIAFGQVGGRDLLLTAHFATVRVWNPRTGRKIIELPFGTSIDAMDVHQADDRLIVAVSGPGLAVVELRDST